MTESFWKSACAPACEEIEAIACGILASLPHQFDGGKSSVLLRVEEFPADEVLESMAIDDGYELTGLYEGIPLTEKSVLDQPVSPDMIYLFRLPLLSEWAERGNVSLGDLIANVVVHELAHHYGWSDEDIARIDRWWE